MVDPEDEVTAEVEEDFGVDFGGVEDGIVDVDPVVTLPQLLLLIRRIVAPFASDNVPCNNDIVALAPILVHRSVLHNVLLALSLKI